MKVVAIVQARIGSTRLPGKVLKPLRGRTVLEHVLRRVAKAGRVDEVVLATTVVPEDDVLEQMGGRLGVRVVRGPVDDVLSRYALAMHASAADHVVRITADCPCTDPDVIDRVVAHHLVSQAEYTSNTHPRTFPHGLDVEVVKREVLLRAAGEATTAQEREHVTPFIWLRPERFRLCNLEARPEETMPELHVTLDTREDYVMLQAVFDLLPSDDFHAADLVQLAKAHPWLPSINAAVRQKLTPVKEPPSSRIRREISEAVQWACKQELYWVAHLLLGQLDVADRLATELSLSPREVQARCRELEGNQKRIYLGKSISGPNRAPSAHQ